MVANPYVVERGDLVKDRVTGFTGTVYAKIDYLNGCTRFQVSSTRLQDGKPVDDFFDGHQLEVLEKAHVPPLALGVAYAANGPSPERETAPEPPAPEREVVRTGGPARVNPPTRSR